MNRARRSGFAPKMANQFSSGNGHISYDTVLPILLFERDLNDDKQAILGEGCNR